MECPVCKLDRVSSSFFCKEMCYKCQYKKKFSELKKRKKTCGICYKELKGKKLKYCSYECADIAKAAMDKKHWTKRVLSPVVRFT